MKMINLLSVLAQGALSEIFFYVSVSVILLPFSIVDYLIIKKISALKPLFQTRFLAKLNKTKMISSVAVMVVLPVCVGCLLRFAFHVDVLQSDWVLLALFALSISSLAVTMCIFDFIRYAQLKKQCAKEKESADDHSQGK